MWKLDRKEDWVLKNRCFQTVVLYKTLKSPFDCNEIKPVNPKGSQPLYIHWKDWYWSSNTLASWCKELTHWKRPWCWERLRAKEEGSRGWDGWMAPRLSGHEFEQTPGDSEGQGSLACYSLWLTMNWTWLSDWTAIKGQLNLTMGMLNLRTKEIQVFKLSLRVRS